MRAAQQAFCEHTAVVANIRGDLLTLDCSLQPLCSSTADRHVPSGPALHLLIALQHAGRQANRDPGVLQKLRDGGPLCWVGHQHAAQERLQLWAQPLRGFVVDLEPRVGQYLGHMGVYCHRG
jgi:hypothetical protein